MKRFARKLPKMFFITVTVISLLLAGLSTVSAFWYSCPARSKVTCPTGCTGFVRPGFDCRPWYTPTQPHRGVDIHDNGLSPMIGAAGEGWVRHRGLRSGYGETVEIEHHWSSLGPLGVSSTVIRYTRYAHLASNSYVVELGDWVTTNQDIARMGNTGTGSGGIHLHWEVRSNQDLGPGNWFYIHLNRDSVVSRGQSVWVDDGP